MATTSLLGAGVYRQDKDSGMISLMVEPAIVFQVEVFAILQVATSEELKNGHEKEICTYRGIEGKKRANEFSTHAFSALQIGLSVLEQVGIGKNKVKMKRVGRLQADNLDPQWLRDNLAVVKEPTWSDS